MRENGRDSVVSDAKPKRHAPTLACCLVALSPERSRSTGRSRHGRQPDRTPVHPARSWWLLRSDRAAALPRAQRDAVQAGRVLDVTWVVDGTLMHVGDRLRASARLLWVPDGTAAWSDNSMWPGRMCSMRRTRLCERVAHALGRHMRKAPGGTAQHRRLPALTLAGLNHAPSPSRRRPATHASELFGHACRSIRSIRLRMSALPKRTAA